LVEIKLDNDKCDGCGTCKDTCPVSVLDVVDGKSKVVDMNACLACHACEVQCPNACIQIID
jgi:NAD-dependent dihydropyrimidine dehydrogenase PreA subunit